MSDRKAALVVRAVLVAVILLALFPSVVEASVACAHGERSADGRCVEFRHYPDPAPTGRQVICTTRILPDGTPWKFCVSGTGPILLNYPPK